MGGNVFYTPEHWQQARKLLQNHDLPLQSLPQDSKRSAAARHGGMSEKLGTRGVHKGEVAFKLLGNCLLDGQQVALPPQLSLVSKAEDLLVCVECDVVCVVENWETFTDLHHYEWIDWHGKSAMVIFHGDNIYSNENAKRAVEARSEPIWAFMDFDPAGLGFSTILPQTRLERVVLPDFEWLATAAKNTIGRMLFDDQVGQWGPTLDRCSHPEIKKAWEALKSQRATTRPLVEEQKNAVPTVPVARAVEVRMMGHKKTSANMNFIKLFRSPKLNPRLEVMRFAIYGIALGAAFVVLKPEIMILAGEVSCRWSSTSTAVEIDDCEHPSPTLKKQSPAQNYINGAPGQ